MVLPCALRCVAVLARRLAAEGKERGRDVRDAGRMARDFCAVNVVA